MQINAMSVDSAEVVFAISGEIDIATAPQLWERVASTVSKGTKRLVLDLTDMDFIDASGISVIVRARPLLADDAQIVLRRPNRLARKVFEIVELDKLCRVENTRAVVGRDTPELDYDGPTVHVGQIVDSLRSTVAYPMTCAGRDPYGKKLGNRDRYPRSVEVR
jgi:anti-anti-sigma factor